MIISRKFNLFNQNITQKFTLLKYSQLAPLAKLTEDEILMKKTFSKFSNERIAPLVYEMEKNQKIDARVLQGLFEFGLMGIEIPKKFGGSDLNLMTTTLAIEEISKVDSSVSVLVHIQNIITKMFKELGTDEQNKKYLTKLVTDSVGSFAFTEPSSGFDPCDLKTTAKKEGSNYILNGTKMWISNSDIADVFLLMANADMAKGYRGITTFILDRNMEGLSVGEKKNKSGLRASGTCMIHLDNVKVPEENILGELGKGYPYIAKFLSEGKIGVAAQLVGLSQGCYDATIPYLLKGKKLGKEINNFQIANIMTNIETARLLTYNAAKMKETGYPYKTEASMCKLFASEVAQRTTLKCIDLMGTFGMTKNIPQEKFYRDCKIGTMYEGISCVQLNTIAKLFPKEYKYDYDHSQLKRVQKITN